MLGFHQEFVEDLKKWLTLTKNFPRRPYNGTSILSIRTCVILLVNPLLLPKSYTSGAYSVVIVPPKWPKFWAKTPRAFKLTSALLFISMLNLWWEKPSKKSVIGEIFLNG
jgi:hypothetical protein